jgi:hypothetical protein
VFDQRDPRWEVSVSTTTMWFRTIQGDMVAPMSTTIAMLGHRLAQHGAPVGSPQNGQQHSHQKAGEQKEGQRVFLNGDQERKGDPQQQNCRG